MRWQIDSITDASFEAQSDKNLLNMSKVVDNIRFGYCIKYYFH